MNKLIEKIEALYNERRDKREFSGDYRGGWDDCVERLSDIIQSEFAETELPINEGLHLSIDRHGVIKCIDVKIDQVPYYFDSYYREVCNKCRWINISAIVPANDGE